MTYMLARIFTSEEARCNGRPLHLEVVDFIRRQRISARVMVTKGVAGCYENGEVASLGVEALSANLPLEITVVMPRAEALRLLPELEAMVDEGLMTVEETEVRWHKCRQRMVPRQVRVRDAMTREPRSLPLDAPVSEALRILLSSAFHGIPVVDPQRRPVGMVTHGDLLRHTQAPVRVGFLRQLGGEHLDALDVALAGMRLADIMGRPAVTVREGDLLSRAVEVMLRREVKRLPVVDEGGVLTGMLSRLDVFRTIMDAAPDWRELDRGGVTVAGGARARDAMRQDTPVLPPDAPVLEAIKRIDSTGIRRVAVLDPQGRLLGLVSDKVLVAAFSGLKRGYLDLLVSRLPLPTLARRHRDLLKVLRARTVGEIMLTDIVAVGEDDDLEAALRLMVERSLKRIPVLDGEGRFRGMLTRDSLLRAALSGPEEGSRS